MKYEPKNNAQLQRMDKSFIEELQKIAKIRWFNKVDKGPRPIGIHRIQSKLIKTPQWQEQKKLLSIAEFLDDKKGFLTQFNLFVIIVVSFIAILLFAGLMYATGLLNNAMHDAGITNDLTYGGNACFGYSDKQTCESNSCSWVSSQCVPKGYVNMTAASDATFGQMNSGISGLRLVALCLIFALFLGGLFINLAAKAEPAYFFVYILIVVLAILLAAPVSNAYQTLLTSNIYGGNILPSFTGANYVMINLPIFVCIEGILGGVFLFINIFRSGGGNLG